MSNELGFAHFLTQSDGVARAILTALLLMSLGSWFLIVQKGIRAAIAARAGRRFLKSFWSAPSLDAVAAGLRGPARADPFSALVREGLRAIEQHRRRDEAHRLVDAGSSDAFLTRALKRSIGASMARLEAGQAFLATVASTAPFVGLLGTVWGIHHALVAIGAAGDAGLDKVAGPVGEALIMTGLGLAVAIPAAVGYNVFTRSNRRVRAELESFAHDLFAFVGTGTKAPAVPAAGPGDLMPALQGSADGRRRARPVALREA